MGTVKGIAIRERSKAPMQEIQQASISFETGVATDSRGKFKGKRQVTVLSLESWEESCEELMQNIPWTTRRANLLVSGLELENTTGQKLRIGACELEITGELEPCERMDAQYEGLTQVLKRNWRGGVCCKILSEGEIQIGDAITLIA